MSDDSTGGQIEELVSKVGDRVETELEMPEGESGEIYLCKHGDSTYTIVTLDDWDYHEVRFQFDIVGAIAVMIHQGGYLEDDISPIVGAPGMMNIDDLQDENEIQDMTENEQYEYRIVSSDEDWPEAAEIAMEIMESVNQEVYERFSYNLFQELSDPMVSANIERRNGIPTGFVISRKIFLQDSGFSVTEFNHTVQAVMSKGIFGKNTVADTLLEKIEIPEEFIEE